MLRRGPRVCEKLIDIYKMRNTEIIARKGVLLDSILLVFLFAKLYLPSQIIDTLSFMEIRSWKSRQLKIGEGFGLNQESNKLPDARGTT